MNAKLFSEAMNEVNDKYYEEAASYHCKKYGWRKWSMVAACLAVVLVLCGFGYAAYIYWGVGSAGNIDFADLTKPFGTIASDKDSPVNGGEIFYEKSKLINDYSNVYADNSVCVTVDGSSIPSIYFSPNYMVIFTQKVINFPLTSPFLRKYSWMLDISSMGSITKLHLVERGLTLAI